MKKQLLAAALAFVFGCKEEDKPPPSGGGSGLVGTSGTFIDARDSKPYKWVKIGEQFWMAENLNYDAPDNATDMCYGNDADNCAKYGRLYDFATAKAACPAGWRLPSDSDWGRLMRYVYSDNKRRKAGKYLKAKDGWNAKTEGGSGGGEDKYGFAALPGGYRLSSGKGGDFDNAGNYGFWWSASIDESKEYDLAYSRFMDYNQEDAYRAQDETDALFSVRCMQGADKPPSPGAVASDTFVDNRDSKAYRYIKIGTQTWMADNLNYKTPDGTSRCYPTSGSINSNDLDNANCDKYGRLYNWKTAMSACPSGWHIPNNADWDALEKYANPNCPQQPSSTEESGTICPSAGTKLKAVSGWDNDGYGDDAYGFAALPGGCKTAVGNDFGFIGSSGNWWSASESNAVYAIGKGRYAYRMVMYDDLENTAFGDSDKNSLYSVRCLKD